LAEDAPAITWETLQSVQEDGYALVRGRPVAATGTRTFEENERVPVAWKNGKPQAILGHRWRRAQFGQTFRTTVSGIVEELFVGNMDDTNTDVWYRNHEQVVKLDILGSLAGQIPQTVKWGLDGNSFAVACSNGYYAVFTLDRPDPNVVDEASPGTATFLSINKPLDANSTLVSVTYQKRRTKTYKHWFGDMTNTITYTQGSIQGFLWPLYWYWAAVYNIVQAWNGEEGSSATASAGTTKTFGLKDLLAGTITDFQGESGKVSAQVLDWVLDTDLHVKFLLSVSWNNFKIGTNQSAMATLHYQHGSGQNGMQGEDEIITVGGGAMGTIGAQKSPTLGGGTVPETHMFLYDGTAQAVTWATAAGSVTEASESLEFGGRLFEHIKTTDTGRPAGGNPPQPGSEPTTSEMYYGGANWSNIPLVHYNKNVGTAGDERGKVNSSTGTYQLFDPALLSIITGPFIQLSSALFERTSAVIGGWNAHWFLTYATETGSEQRLWHYRIATAQLFQTNQDVRLFLVVERYPFIAGTGYINDIPQVGIFLVTKTGSLVRTLRSFQNGLGGGSLLTGNAHRILWILLDGSYLAPTASYKHTNLDDGVEVSFTPTQRDKFLSGKARLYSPDFLWERVDPQPFYLMADLPEMKEDESLDEYSKLMPVTDAPDGSVRIVNDETILDPLDRYSPT